MQGLLQGKVALITGAGSGVGRAATLLFAQHGARVLACDVDATAAERSAALAREQGGEATAARCDVTDAAAVSAAVATAVQRYGRLDIMYNNAGITVRNLQGRGVPGLADTPPEELARVRAVNVDGVVHGCQAALRQFDAQGGGGVIVNTASVAGLHGYGGTVYGATKGAVVALTRTLAIEVAPRGIRVNSVCPAGMLTHFAGLDPDAANAEAIRAGMGKAHPLGRVIDPLDCANAALFLASDLAANITGVNLPVDGGLSAGTPVRR